MKRRLSAALIGAISLSLVAAGPVASAFTNVYAAETADNLIKSGSFDSDSTGWGLYSESCGDASFTVKDGKMVISIADSGYKAHAVQIYFDGFSLIQGAKYKLTFEMSSSVARTFEWRAQVNGGDYHAYAGDEEAAVGTDTTAFEYEFTMEEETDPSPRFCFNLGDADRKQELGAHEIIIDNVCLVLTDDSGAVAAEDGTGEIGILINQVGYRPSDEKRAIFRDASLDTEFSVVDEKTGKEVYTGALVKGVSAGTSGETVAYGDFSSVTTPGTYKITAANSGESYSFTIAEDVYKNLFADSVKMLYLQRCGMELTEDTAGDFAHAACHTETAFSYETGEKIEVSGGWHDAGDYGRYTVPAAKAVADLMLAYERNASVFTDDTGIPESGNGVADILDETRYELEWMLKMQNEEGGVYHKVTGLNFDATVMPEECTDTLYVLPVSETATADFAAAMYMASRIYADVDADFSAICLTAAEKALAYAQAHTDAEPFTNPSDVLTGEYPDTNASDEILWALCEGYKTTQDSALADEIAAFDFGSLTANGLGWGEVSDYAYYAYLTSDASIDAVDSVIRDAFLTEADMAKEAAETDSYGSSILGDYPWGSNMTIGNNGMLLYMAADLTGDSSYEKAAALQLDYLLGCNTTGYSFVSGYGTLYPEHPHHRPSQALGKAVPGMVAGGPDSNLEDPYAQNVLQGLEKAHCYADSDQSYSTNEITIYWNSPFIYLLSSSIRP